MTSEEWALAAAVVCAGLWSGLLGMLTLVMHPMLERMDGRDFERFLRAFLPVGRKAWFNYACAIGMAVAPILGLITLWDDPSSAAFILCAIGLALVIVGVYVVSNVWKEPHYDVMLAWDADAMPSEWKAGRRRYFTLNWIQAVSDVDGIRPVPARVAPHLAPRALGTQRLQPASHHEARAVGDPWCGQLVHLPEPDRPAADRSRHRGPTVLARLFGEPRPG